MRPTLVSLVVFGVVVAGCGGGGGGKAEHTITDKTVVNVTWPDRSRAVLDAPSSALSAKFTFSPGDPNGNDVSFTVDRDPAQLASHVETYHVPGFLKMGDQLLTMTFFSSTGGKGIAVASSGAPVKVTYGGFNMPTITLSDVVKSVAVSPTTAQVGHPATLTFTAYDASNNVVAVSPGSEKWHLVSGAANATLSTDGILTPNVAGTCGVTAVVDKVSSPVTTINLTP